MPFALHATPYARRASHTALALSLALARCAPATAPADTSVAADATVEASDGPALDATTPEASTAPPTPYEGPDDVCPGRPHCAGAGDGPLYVGFARELINPTLVETEWEDRNNDGHYDSSEPFTDRNGNGVFDATWVAGFGAGRPARGQHDDLEARAIAFRRGDTSVALVVLDAVGYFIDDAERVRSHPELRGVDVDRVLVASTHVHQGVDTVGLWGRHQLESGRDPQYLALTYERAARAVRRALEAARPATLRVAQTPTADPTTGDTRAYVNDVRDPIVYDPTVTLVHFVDATNPSQTLGSLVHWSAHPEYAGSRNNQLSADYVHQLRETVERGLPARGVPGLGGTAVFLNGALGGQLGPGGGVAPLSEAGVPLREASLERAEAAGRNVGALALAALARVPATEAVAEAPVSYRTAPLFARAQNVAYHLLYRYGVLARELLAFNPRRPVTDANMPWVRSRVTYLQVGPVAMISAPGELHPDLWVGTRDERWSWGQPVLHETENRPDLALAPPPPYLRDLVLENPGVRYPLVAGLTEDFLGYIVPAYNYVLHPQRPYLDRAAGDHYEETNSIGPDAEAHLFRAMVALTQWRPR